MAKPSRAKIIAARIAAQVSKQAGKGLQACAIFLAARVKETVSIPAPRKRVVNRLGDISYRASVKATPGMPPRKLSGKLRQSVTWQMASPVRALVGVNARSARNFNYPRHHELRSGHKFLEPTARRWHAELVRIMGRKIRVARPG